MMECRKSRIAVHAGKAIQDHAWISKAALCGLPKRNYVTFRTVAFCYLLLQLLYTSSDLTFMAFFAYILFEFTMGFEKKQVLYYVSQHLYRSHVWSEFLQNG